MTTIGTIAPPSDDRCPYCSGGGTAVYHLGGHCPRVKSIEYHKDGTVKRVEFHGPPVAPPLALEPPFQYTVTNVGFGPIKGVTT